MSKNETILVVDDNPDNLQVLKKVLQKFLPDSTIRTCQNAEKAQEILSENDVALALLDVQMAPDINGIELCKRIKSNAETKHVSVILITSHIAKAAHKALGLKIGADDFILRPIDNTELIARVKVVLRTYNAEAELRKHNQETTISLDKSEQMLQAVFNNVKDGIMVVALANHRIHTINPAMKHMLGYDIKEITSLSLLDIHPKNEHTTVIEAFERQASGSSPLATNILIKRKDGSVFYADINAAPATIGDQSFLVGTIRDVTERKKLEEQFAQAQKLESVGRLAGGVAHDFNNLLSVINGYSECLLDDIDQEDPRREDIIEIKRAGERATSLTSQLLAFSRKQVMNPITLCLNNEIFDINKILERLIGEDINIVTDAQSDLGWINADPGQIQQIIMNLAVNARDAMPKGGVLTIETANVELNKQKSKEFTKIVSGQYIMMAVSDTGIGMDAKTQANIFEPFFTTKGLHKGTGLGLSTVYGIMEQNHGSIMLESEPGKGATFRLYFPRVEFEGKTSKVQKPRDKKTRTRPKETVLLVEDEASLRALVKRILTGEGYTILEAPDGIKALSLAKEYAGKIDLLLTDVVMPGLNGKEVFSQIKPIHPGSKVLYISGYPDPRITNGSVSSLEGAFLSKPFTAEKLTNKIFEVMNTPNG